LDRGAGMSRSSPRAESPQGGDVWDRSRRDGKAPRERRPQVRSAHMFRD
jgi:hypothetical protein